MLDCTVHYGNRSAILRVNNQDSITALTARACEAFSIRTEGGDGAPILRSRRLQTDMVTNAIVDECIKNGDDMDLVILHGARVAPVSTMVTEKSHKRLALKPTASLSRSVFSHHRSTKTVHAASKRALFHTPDGLPGCRLGVFVVSPIKAENLVPVARFRTQRVSLTARLQPYTNNEQVTPTVNGLEYAWSTSLRFKHVDSNASGLLILIDVYEDPPLGSQVLVGRGYVTLEDALDAPGVSMVRWIRIDCVNGGTGVHTLSGRLLISLCFHPKVSKGPTVHAYLHALAHGDTDQIASSDRPRSSSPTKRSFLRTLFGGNQRRQQELITGQAAALQRQQALRRTKGTLSVRLRGIHLCGSQCSNIDGHSSLSLPEFAPVVLVQYDSFEDEIRINPTECENAILSHEWPVYSTFATIELEICRRVTLVTGSTSRKLLSDGSTVVKIGGVSLSCFDIQERVAASWTLDPPAPLLGPGRSVPLPGYDWYPIMMGDEEIGLAQISANYSEDVRATIDTEESADLLHIRPDERTFDAVIVQRNFERLDELYTVVKEISGWIDDTLDWKSPTRTVLAWATINLCFFLVPGDHLPLIMILFVLVLLSATAMRFLRGETHKKWIELTPTTSRLKTFRPIAKLRVAPLRATHVSSINGPDDQPDSFVRVVYEPNFKKLPVRIVAQTECARRNKNPDWSRPQRESLNRDAFPMVNNSRLKDMFRHLTPFAQNTILHDVVEPWPRQDGGTDVNAFRFSVLQPVHVDASSGEEELIEWPSSPAVIRFDVMQDNGAGEPSTLVGRVRLPIRSLVSNETEGGTQEELTLHLPLALPPRHATSSSTATTRHRLHHVNSILIVRVQLTLRNPSDRVTLTETLSSEALYEATELEAERELSWVEKYHKAKDVAKNIQQALGSICSTLERFKNLFLWVHPQKTLLMYGLLVVASIGFYVAPLRYIVLYTSTKKFTRRFHKAIDKDLVRLQNLLITIPTDLDMKRMYHRQNQEYLLAKEHSEAQAKLKALWSGDVLCQRFSWLQTWHDRYCAIRGGRLELWQCIGDAKAGLPPKHSYLIGNVVDTCTKAESQDVPRDCYPLVVVDLTRSALTMIPSGKRRIFCFKTEEAMRGFADAAQATGEPIDRASRRDEPESPDGREHRPRFW